MFRIIKLENICFFFVPNFKRGRINREKHKRTEGTHHQFHEINKYTFIVLPDERKNIEKKGEN